MRSWKMRKWLPFQVDETIFELNENFKATLVKKAPKSLREHANLEDYVLKHIMVLVMLCLW